MPDSKLNEVYAQGMKQHPYGYALFKPRDSTIIKPGLCGFFDDNSNWTTIVDTTTIPDNHTHFQPLKKKYDPCLDQPETLKWGPQYSQSVTSKWFDVTGKVK